MSSVLDILNKYGSNSQANPTNAWNSPAQRQQTFTPQSAQNSQPNLAQRWQMSQRNSAGTITGQVQKPTQQEFLSRYIQTPEFKPTKAPTLQEEREQKWDALPDWQKKLAKDLNPYNAAELNKERDTIDANLKNAQAIVNAVNGNPAKFAGNADAKQAYDWARDYLNGGAKLRDELSYMQTDEDYKKYLDSQQKSIETYERRANLDLDKAHKDLEELKAQRDTATNNTAAAFGSGSVMGVSFNLPKNDYEYMQLDAKIKELEDDIAYVERRKENEEKYRSLLKDPAFGNNAQYLSNGDLKYEYINGNQDAVYQRMNDNLTGVSVNPNAINEWNVGEGLGTAVTAAMDEWRIYQYMTPEEIAIYNALYKEDQLKPQQSGEKKSEGILDYLGWTGTKDIESQYESKAEDYLKFLEPELNERARYAEMKQAREYAKEHSFLASGASVVMSPFKAYTYLTQAADILSGQGLDQNAQSNAFSYMNTAIRDQVGKEISKNAGKNGEFAYQTAMSMADNLWQSFITGTMAAGLTKESIAIAEHAMLAIMSAGAAADSVIAAKDRGLSDGQAFAIGTAAGAVEYATEKIGVDRLFASLENGESFVKAMLANALAEGGEEILGNGMNEVLDFIINGMDSERMQRIKELMDQGYTESQAAGIAFGEFGLETLKEGASGALSGAAFGGGTGVVSYVSSAAYYASVANNAQKISANALNPEGVAGGFNWNTELQKGLAAPKDSKAYKTAQVVQRQVERTGNINSVTYGRLITELAGDIRNKYLAINALDRADVLTDEERHNWQILRDNGGIRLSSDLSTWGGTNPYIWQVQTAAYEALNKYYDDFTAKHETEFKAWQAEQKDKIRTAYTDAGVSFANATDIEEIIDKLVLGEYVTEAQINKLHLTDPKYADLFYMVTGVDVDPSQNIYVQAGQARNAIPPAELTSLEEAHLAREALNAQPTPGQTLGETPMGGTMTAPTESAPAESATPAPQPNLSGETALSVAAPTALAVQPSNSLPAVGERTSVNRSRLEQPTGRAQTEARIRGVQNRISELTAEGERRRSAQEAEQFRIAQLSDDLFKARQDVADAKKELADLKKDYEDTLRDMADLELRADRALRGNAKKLTKKEQADLYELQRHWEDDLADYDDQVEQLEQKVAELSKVMETASGEYYAAANNMTIDSGLNQDLRNEIRDLNLELARLESELESIDEEEAKQAEENIEKLDILLRLNDYIDDVVYDDNGAALDYDEYAESIRNDPDSEGMTEEEIAESFMQLVDAIQEAEAEAVRSYTASSIEEQDALVKTLNERLGVENEFHMADDNELLDNPELVANGVYDDKTGNIYFSRDLTTQQILQWTLAHELLHQAKTTTDGAIVDDVLDTMLRMNARGLIEGGVKVWLDNYDEWFEQQAKMYRQLDEATYADTPMGRSNVREELAAQLMRLVLPQTKFWNNLAQVKAPLLLRLYNGIQTRSRANDAYTKAMRRLTRKMEDALHLTEEQKDARYQLGVNKAAANDTPNAPTEAEMGNEEAVTASYNKYSINYATIDYARKHTGLSESSETAIKSIYRLAELQKQIGKTIRKELPQGHWRMNIHNMNEYLANHHEVWQELLDIQESSNKAGVPVDFVTPIQDSWEFEGKEVEAGLKGFPIEYVTKEDGGYKFNGFARTLSQLYIDHMADSARWKLQDEMIAAVEDAYEKKVSVADPTPQLSKMLKAVIEPTEIRNIGSKTKLYAQTALRSASKTVAALNLNSACPMFTVGNHGCYLDACYLTQMGSGGNTVNLFQSAIYAGEILQLSDKAIETLNRDPDGLRVNGVGDTVAGNKGAFFAALRHAAMRGLKLKIITKQTLTLDLLREAANRGIDISKVQVQLSMDNIWVPVELDDAWGSGIRGNVGIANTISKFEADLTENPENRENRAAAVENAYGEFFGGREVSYRNAETGEQYGVETKRGDDGVWYRKYGFTDARVKELIEQYPEITILPRYVVCTAPEIAELALGHGALGDGPFIQTLMHGVVPEPCFSEYGGEDTPILNFGSLRHVVEKNSDGIWEFYGARVSKNKETGKVTVTRQNSKAHKAVDDYIKKHYTPEQQNIIYTNLQKQLCCKASENIDACAGCASLFAGGCSLCQAVRAKKNQNYAPNPELTNPYEDKPVDLRSLAERGETQKFSLRGESSYVEDFMDTDNLRLAKTMEARGAEPGEIRVATGWFKQSDGKWRKEFSSKDLKFKPQLDEFLTTDELFPAEKEYAELKKLTKEYESILRKKQSDRTSDLVRLEREIKAVEARIQELANETPLPTVPLDRLIEWPELFKYYPQFANIPVVFSSLLNTGINEGVAGQWSPTYQEIRIAPGLSKEYALDVLVHEVQHAIQDAEGFAYDSDRPYEQRRGEIEAYDAQKRRTWTDARRQKNPPQKFSISRLVNTDGMTEEQIANAAPVVQSVLQRGQFADYFKSEYASYTTDRIEHELEYSIYEYEPDTTRTYIAWIDPRDFVRATTDAETAERIKAEAGELDVARMRAEYQTPYLRIDFGTGEIRGHEGRHRMQAMADAGINYAPVLMDDIRGANTDAQPISIQKLEGQFSKYRGFYLHNALPMDTRYAEVIKKAFGAPRTDVKFSVSQKQDADYMAAVNSGDMETAQRMVDEAAKAAGYTYGKVYHGTPNTDFTEFNDGIIFFTSNEDTASEYEDASQLWRSRNPQGRTIGAYIRLDNPLTLDNSYSDYRNEHTPWQEWKPTVYGRIPENAMSSSDVAERAKAEGYDGVFITNDKDTKWTDSSKYLKNRGRGDTVIAFKAEQIKSADPVTYDADGNVIPLSKRFNSEDRDIRYSISPKMQAKLDAQLAKYGAQKQSSRDARDVQIPNKVDVKGETRTVSRTPRTVANAQPITEDSADKIRSYIVNGKFTYLPTTHKTLTDNAELWIKQHGWVESVRLFLNDVQQGRVSGELTARGALLLNNASNGSDEKTFLKLLNGYVQMLRNAAQGAEAAKILQQLTPDGQLAGIMDVMQGINTAIDKLNKQGKGVTEIKLPDELLAEYRRQTSEEGRNSVVDKMAKSVASQMRVTALDRWTAIRYLNMLGNFKTQIRNVVGNTVMQVANFVKDELAGALDKFANPNDRTTSAAFDVATLKEVWKLYKNYAADIEGGGRYNDSASTGFLRQVEDVNKVFGRTGFAAWDKTGGRVLEGMRFGTNFAMREGDAIFSRFAFAMSVARFMKANNTTWSQAKEPMRVRAINKAIQDAAETTYHDNNVLSTAMSRAFRSETTPAFFKVLAEGILPFRKTPANILMRAYEYSPLSIIEDTVKTIQYERAKAGKGKTDLAELNITGGDLVNRWAKTLTGTGLVILGFFLASWGLLRGKKSDDKNEAELQEQIGYQAYSIKVGNKYITFDWAAPACIPLFLGANLCDAMGSNGLTLKDATTALLRVADPLISMSMLQGINDSLENAATYGTDSALGSFVVNAVWSYFSQGLTNTLLGQAERSWSNQRMQTYVDKNSWMPDQLQRFVGKSSAKVPGWDYNQIPYVDAWGNIEENADTEGWNIANQFLFPWYRKEYDKNAILEEVERLYHSTGDGGVVLTRPGKNFKIQITDENGNPIYDDKGNPKTETLDLSPDQYVTFAMTRGQIATRIVSDLLESEAYKAMSDADKAKTLKAVYTYATGIGAKTVDDHHSINSTLREALQGYQDFDIPESTYYTAWTTLGQISGYKDAKGDTVTNSSGILKAEALDQMYPNLTKEQRDFLLEALGVGKTVRGWNKNLIAAKAKGLRNQYGG